MADGFFKTRQLIFPTQHRAGESGGSLLAPQAPDTEQADFLELLASYG